LKIVLIVPREDNSEAIAALDNIAAK
jgi:hypothetical protein